MTPAIKNTCPVCGEDSVFKPFGSIRRENVQCPVCETVERHRLLYFFLRDWTDFFTAPLSVIHFSPNPGLGALFRRQANLRYVAVNRASDDGSSPLEVDLTDTRLPDSCFDVAVCYHVFEHIRDDRSAMSEFFRILKPGGWAVTQVPVRGEEDTLEDAKYDSPEMRALYYGQSNHVRFYGWRDFVDRLRGVGFDVSVVQPALSWSVEAVEKYRLVRDEKIYFLKKRQLQPPTPR